LASKKTSATADREIVTTRVVNAPRGARLPGVDRSEDPRALVGADGLHQHLRAVRAAAGRRLALRHARPDGGTTPNKSVFAEIKRPERLVFHHESAPQFHVTVTFRREAGQDDQGHGRDALRDRRAARLDRDLRCRRERGQNFDRLEAELAEAGAAAVNPWWAKAAILAARRRDDRDPGAATDSAAAP
jgi:hypothetical protein